MDEILAVALFGFWIFCVVDVLFTAPDRCRRLPKFAWLVIVVFLSWLGSAIWLIAGRPRRAVPADAPSYASATPTHEQIGGSNADDAEFLRQCRARAEEQRATYRQSMRDDQA